MQRQHGCSRTLAIIASSAGRWAIADRQYENSVRATGRIEGMGLIISVQNLYKVYTI